jgi:hypothetical protein
MGLLDDAIREHLDLKRRRGADPAEIERAEREALGPVRRGPEELEEPDRANGPGVYDDDLAEPQWDESSERPTADATGGGQSEAPPHGESYTGEESSDLGRQGSTAAPERAPSGGRDDDDVAGETAEYDVPRELEHEGNDESDDMLQETPEFLQDTPDHDRLWFEQRPPRDFDFDH